MHIIQVCKLGYTNGFPKYPFAVHSNPATHLMWRQPAPFPGLQQKFHVIGAYPDASRSPLARGIRSLAAVMVPHYDLRAI